MLIAPSTGFAPRALLIRIDQGKNRQQIVRYQGISS
jgi:hypothetical protein